MILGSENEEQHPSCMYDNKHKMRSEMIDIQDTGLVFTIYCEICLEIFYTQPRRDYKPKLKEELR